MNELRAIAYLLLAMLVACAPLQSPSSSEQGKPMSTTQSSDLDLNLIKAAWANDVAEAKRLVKAGASVNAKDETVQSAYLISTSEGYLDLLRLALQHGAIINDKDSWNGTGLIRAAERGHYLIVGQLLQSGISKDHVNRIGYQAIHEAIWLGKNNENYLATLRVLAAGGVKLTQPSGNERLTPLQMVERREYPLLKNALERILQAPAPTDPDAALLAAAASGDADAAAVALRNGAEIEARDERGRTPLLLASAADHVDVARVLVALGASPNAIDGQSDTPWLVTGVTGSVAMLETLLPGQPDFKIVNRYGGVSVIPAAERGHVDYVRRVVQTGIDVNHVNRLGWTALLEAVILGDGGSNHQEIVRILLAAGADKTIADKDAITALEHARRRGHKTIVEILGG